MTRLTEAMRAMGLNGEVDLSDRWVKLQGEQATIYIVEASWGNGYYMWCDDPRQRVVEHYTDPRDAIEAGLRRSSKQFAQEIENDDPDNAM